MTPLQGGSVKLSLLDNSTCDHGAFMCEVVYISSNFSKSFLVAMVRPNKEVSPAVPLAEDLVQRVSQIVASSAAAINSSIQQFSQMLKEDRLQPAFILKQQWKLAFRGTAHIKKSIYYAYKYGTGIPDDLEPGCLQVDKSLPCRNHYRNGAILDNWRDVSEVALVIYKNSVRVGYAIFDGVGSNYLSWMDRGRLKASSWLDLKTRAVNVFSIYGHVDPPNRCLRRFYMNSVFNACRLDEGWFAAVDNEDEICPWAQNGAFPVFYYSKTEYALNWNSHDVGRADVMAIFVKYLSFP